MERGLKEITIDSIDTVLDLIAQNSLYRGEEHLEKVKNFKALKIKYDKFVFIIFWLLLIIKTNTYINHICKSTACFNDCVNHSSTL